MRKHKRQKKGLFRFFCHIFRSKLVQKQQFICIAHHQQRQFWCNLAIRQCLQCDNSGIIFLSSLFPKSKCLCHSLARRGQPCIMSALTAVQLYRIQSLDERRAKEPCAGCPSPSTLTILTVNNRSYSLNILYWWNLASVFALSCLKLYVRPRTCLVSHPVPKCERQPLLTDTGPGVGHTHSCWFGSFISNPGAPLLMWVCWF